MKLRSPTLRSISAPYVVNQSRDNPSLNIELVLPLSTTATTDQVAITPTLAIPSLRVASSMKRSEMTAPIHEESAMT